MPKVKLIAVHGYDDGCDLSGVCLDGGHEFVEITDEELDFLKDNLYKLPTRDSINYRLIEDSTPKLQNVIEDVKKVIEKLKIEEENRAKAARERKKKDEAAQKEKDIKRAKKLLKKWGEDGK